MNAADWQIVKEALDTASRLEPEEKSAYLDRICQGRADLRSEIESLLNAHEEAEDFLEAPPAESLIGRKLGAYRVTGVIGEGGMGSVYRAVRDDDSYTQEVAVKVLKRGMDTAAVVSRFRSERQILANMEHPNIGRLFDGGTTPDGLPYFVMELIEGTSLTDFCDRNRFSTIERLKLFRKVCDAVDYAHRRLVVHRDLKPSNILVTAAGEPKLLDFGIAKIMSPDGALQPTMTFVKMMTPEYASPEQVRGEPVATATDIYSLGVILYELLTGHRPYRLTSRMLHEAALVICQVEPEKPSSVVRRTEEIAPDQRITPDAVAAVREGKLERLQRRLSGDLDNIILKALRKDAQRRYASAAELSEDIWRYLHQLPVRARPDSFTYRAAKFASRNRLSLAAAALAVAGLVGGLAFAVREARIAQAERQRAERRFNDVRKLANSFLFEFHDEVAKLSGSMTARELVVRKALEYLDSLASESAGDLELQRELAKAYQRVGDVQGLAGEANLGDTAGALKSYQKAGEILEDVLRRAPGKDSKMELATIYDRLATVNAGPDRGFTYAQRSVEIRRELAAEAPNDPKSHASLGSGLWVLAQQYVQKGDIPKALEIRLAMAREMELAAEGLKTARSRRNVALAYKSVGATESKLGNFQSALQYLRRAVAIDEQLVKEYPDDVLHRMDLSFGLSDTGYTLRRMGKLEEALQYYRRVLPIRREMAEADPKDHRAQRAHSTTWARIGGILGDLGRTAEAMEALRQAFRIRWPRGLAALDQAEDVEVAEVLADFGDVQFQDYERTRNAASLRQARIWYQRSDAIFRRLEAGGRLSAMYQERVRLVRDRLPRS